VHNKFYTARKGETTIQANQPGRTKQKFNLKKNDVNGKDK